MQTSSQDNQSNAKFGSIRRDILQTMLLVVIVVALSGAIGYFAGFQMGRRQGAKDAVKKVTDLINPLNAISDNPLFPSTILGTASAVNDTSITIKQANGSTKTIVVTDKTEVTKGDKTLTYKDVKKGANVTVLTVGKDKDQTASRIVLR